MNLTQKNFRKQMETAKRQGILPESYEARSKGNVFREHKAGFSLAGVSLIGVLIFCWNVFAVGTWVNSFLHGTSIISAVGSNSNQKAIHEYISANKETQKILSRAFWLEDGEVSRTYDLLYGSNCSS